MVTRNEKETANGIVKEINRDLESLDYSLHNLEISVTYEREEGIVNYFIKHPNSAEILLTDQMSYEDENITTEQAVDALGGTLRDSIEGARIILNGQGIQGESDDLAPTRDFESETI